MATQQRNSTEFWKHQLEYCQKQLNTAEDEASKYALEAEILIAIDHLIDLAKTQEEKSKLKRYIWEVVIHSS